MFSKWPLIAIVITLVALVTAASAQYMPPGGMGPMGGTPGTSPTYSKTYGVNKAAIAAIIGAGATGGVLLFRHYRHRTLTACVGSDGTTLDDGKNVFSLLGGPLTPGEHVVASGKKVKSDGGAPAFEVSSIRKDLGSCGSQTTASLKR